MQRERVKHCLDWNTQHNITEISTDMDLVLMLSKHDGVVIEKTTVRDGHLFGT